MDAKPRPDKKPNTDASPSTQADVKKLKATDVAYDAILLGLISLGVHILGRALITRHDRQNFTVHELSGGLFHVAERDGRMVCTTCRPPATEPDRHAALVLLYVLAVENPGLPPARRA